MVEVAVVHGGDAVHANGTQLFGQNRCSCGGSSHGIKATRGHDRADLRSAIEEEHAVGRRIAEAVGDNDSRQSHAVALRDGCAARRQVDPGRCPNDLE